MKILIPILLSLVAGIFSNPHQAKEIAQRRQILGYTSNVVHENPNYPDQAAQSSVNVDFNPNTADEQPVYLNNYQKELTQHYTPNYPIGAPQSQLFNVGYSMKFTSGAEKEVETRQKYVKSKNLNDGEIITGTKKQNEEVKGPQEYIPAALLKKQKISGIKPKPHYVTNYPNPKILLSQANLSPGTQKYYRNLEQLKPQVQDSKGLQQKYSWRALSPSVEIIRSTEVPVGQRFTKTESFRLENARVLGRSPDFDQSNAVDKNNSPQQKPVFYSSPQAEKTQQIPVVVGPNVVNLPLDTTLLREQFPIQVDTRLIEEAMRNEALLYDSNYPQNQEQVQKIPMRFSLTEGVYSSPRQPREIAQRRQIHAYTNNVVHKNPNYLDQSAQSSVNVNFNANPGDERNHVYTTNYQKEFTQPYTPNYNTGPSQPQLFNVGYSVRFTNGAEQQAATQQKYVRSKKLDEGEIITGTRKYNEEVERPAMSRSPQEYIPATLLKKQKISGIKPKPHYVTNYPNPKVLLSQANLSPVTQKFYRNLEQLKPQIQNTKELQQKYSWRALGPSVEIIRSTEVPVGQRYRNTESFHLENARALGRTPNFDHSNAIDNNSLRQNPLFYSSRIVQPQAEKTQQIPVVLGPNGAKLSLDTSLLKQQIPIQVDTRLINEAMRNGAVLYNSNYPQNQEQNPEVRYLQQVYRTIK